MAVDVEVVGSEDEFDDDARRTAPTMLRMEVVDGVASIVVSWNDQSDLTALADSIGMLSRGAFGDVVLAAIGNFGEYSGDRDSAAVLKGLVAERTPPPRRKGPVVRPSAVFRNLVESHSG